jgi:hypothetical protein
MQFFLSKTGIIGSCKLSTKIHIYLIFIFPKTAHSILHFFQSTPKSQNQNQNPFPLFAKLSVGGLLIYIVSFLQEQTKLLIYTYTFPKNINK